MIQTNIRVLWITMQINSFCLSCSVRYMLAITVSAWAESYKNKQNTTTHPRIKLFLMLYSSFFWVGTKLFLSFECLHRLYQNLIASNALYQIFASNFYPYLDGAGIWESITATKMIKQRIYISNAFDSTNYVCYE